jgi:anti-sigma factor RsiW
VRDPEPELAHPEAAGWALGTLDPGDAEWFAGHLPSCPDCRAAVAEFGPTARLLATAAPADLAPPGLQARETGPVIVAEQPRPGPGVNSPG